MRWFGARGFYLSPAQVLCGNAGRLEFPAFWFLAALRAGRENRPQGQKASHRARDALFRVVCLLLDFSWHPFVEYSLLRKF